MLSRCHLVLPIGLMVICGSTAWLSRGDETPVPIRLVVEAEDFRPTNGDWAVKEFGTNYYASTLAISFLSRGRYLGAPEQGVASQAISEVEIPRDGTFEVWARYEQPYDYAVEFGLEIQQEGTVVFQREYGRRAAPKLWPFKKGLQPQVLWEWGPTDNIVWEGKDSEAKLKKGKATLILKKGPQQDKQAARRNVDVIVITDDKAGVAKQMQSASYLPLDGWLTQQGDVFLRVSNPADAPTPIAVSVAPCTEHSPYWIHVRDWPKQLWIGTQESDKPLTAEQFVKPGARGSYVEVGRLFDTLNQFQWKVNVVTPDGKPAADRKVRLTLAIRTSPTEYESLRSDDVFTTGADGSVNFFLDGDIRRMKRVRTVTEDLESVAALVKSFPEKGKRPEQFRIYGLMGFSSALEQPGRIGDLSREIALKLGSNTLPEVTKPERNGYIDVRHVATKDLKAYCVKLTKDGKADRLKVISLGDEIHIGGDAQSPRDNEAFRGFLTKKGITATDLGIGSLADVRIELKDREVPSYYYSHLFAFEKALSELKERTDILEANLPKGVVSGANYSPHPYYWPKEGQWVRAFKRRAMTLPWGEDYVWQVPEASPQIIGYLLTALRCGAKYYNLPIHWYVMPHYPGTTPDNLRRAYYTAIGHGAKMINFFCATPLSVGYTENYVTSDAKDTWKTIHEIVHETGAFEHVVYPAQPRKADVALLISFAQDLWEPDPAYNHERKCLYLALRQAGYTCDFITEEDIQEGRMDQVKSIYIVGNHLETATMKQLKKWVHDDGGAIAGVAGGGFFDEFNRPSNVLNEVYGIRDQKVELKDKVIMTKQQLPRLEPLDQINYPEGRVKFPAIGAKQTIKVEAKTDIMATYADGSPAVTRHDYGRGMTMLYGSFVGSAYMRGAIPIRPVDRSTAAEGFNHFLPTDYNGFISDLVTAGAGAGNARWDVITNNPLVESVVMQGPKGIGVALINWTDKPQDLKLTVQFVPKEWNKVTSIRQGPLQSTRRAAVIDFKLRVDVTDMVLIEE